MPSLINTVLLIVAVSFLYSSPPATTMAGGILCSRFGPETTELATFKTNTCRYSRDTKVWDAVTDKPTECCVLTIGADDYRTQVLFNNSMLCADSIFVRYERAKGFGKWRKI